MKKLLVVALMALGLGANAQKMNAALNLGLPTEFTAITIAPEFNYMYTVAENVTVGPSVSLYYGIGKSKTISNTVMGQTFEAKIDAVNTMSMPLAAAGRYSFGKISAGIDLGYSIALSNSSSCVFYRPVASYNFMDNLSAQVSFSTFALDGASTSIFCLGVVYGL